MSKVSTRVYIDKRKILLNGNKKKIWAVIESMGGIYGWYDVHRLCIIRGVLDQLVGGPGIKRERRDPRKLEKGDTMDSWRVLRVRRQKELLLKSDMKIPGMATLRFTVEENSKGIRVQSHARLSTRSIFGIVYWYVLSILHDRVFNGMLNSIAKISGSEILEKAHRY